MRAPTTKRARGTHRGSTGWTIGLALGLALGLTPGRAAAEANTCAAGKLKCARTFATAALKCYGPMAKKGLDAKTGSKGEDCVRKARQKLGTAIASGPGCVEKVEARQNVAKPATVCPTAADEYDLDDLVKDFTLTLVEDVLLTAAAPFGSTCDAGKLKCVGTLVKALLGCREKAAKKGVPVDPACEAKAWSKLDGGPNPAKGCFAKLEAKQKLGKLKSLCDPGGLDAEAVVADLVDGLVGDVAGAVAP